MVTLSPDWKVSLGGAGEPIREHGHTWKERGAISNPAGVLTCDPAAAQSYMFSVLGVEVVSML